MHPPEEHARQAAMWLDGKSRLHHKINAQRRQSHQQRGATIYARYYDGGYVIHNYLLDLLNLCFLCTI